MQANARKVYEEHYALVRRVTPPERLLEYSLGDRWEPLCGFLGVDDVPTEPLPEIDEREAFEEGVQHYVRKGMRNVCRNVAVGACSVQALRMYYGSLG